MPPPANDASFDHQITNELVQSISGHIGLLVINWSFIEQAMSSTFEATEELATEAGIPVRRPFGFKEKRSQFKLIFGSIPRLAEYRPRTDPMLTGLENLTPLRDCVVHGTLSRFDPTSRLLTFVKVNPARREAHHEMIDVRVSVDSLEPASDACSRLAYDMQALAGDLVERFL